MAQGLVPRDEPRSAAGVRIRTIRSLQCPRSGIGAAAISRSELGYEKRYPGGLERHCCLSRVDDSRA
jgi:hypothetical protein